MKISTEKPPVYDRLHEAFGIDWDRGVIITYGDTVYVKSGHLKPEEEVHEAVHLRQQSEAESLESFVDRYISDRDFRAEQELEAYRAEAGYLRRTVKDREHLHRRLQHLRRCMVTMYGGMITFEDAAKMI